MSDKKSIMTIREWLDCQQEALDNVFEKQTEDFWQRYEKHRKEHQGEGAKCKDCEYFKEDWCNKFGKGHKTGPYRFCLFWEIKDEQKTSEEEKKEE